MADADSPKDEVDKFFDASSDENEAPKPRSDNDEDPVDNEDEEPAVEEQIPRDRLREIGDTFELPKTSLIRPKQELHSMRIPPFLHIKEKGYAAEEFNELEYNNEQARLNKLSKVRTAQINTIRWRYKQPQTDEGEEDEEDEAPPVRQSNTRIVQWDDGSMHMFIGDKSFEIVNRNSTFSNAFPFVVHSNEMECHGSVAASISLKPSGGFDDENHRMYALQVKKASAKRSKIQTLEQTVNMTKLLQRRRAEAHRRLNAKKQKQNAKKGEGPGGDISGDESPMYADELDEAGNDYDNEFIASEDDILDEEPAVTRRPKRKARRSPVLVPVKTEGSDSSVSEASAPAGDVAFSSSDSEGEVKPTAKARRTRIIADSDSE